MEIKIINIILVFCFILSSNNRVLTKNNNSDNLLKKKELEFTYRLQEQSIRLTNGVFVKFKNHKKDMYKIEWGNKKMKNISTRFFEIIGSGKLSLLKQGDNEIILTQSCGTSCIYYVVLPLKANRRERVFMQAIAYDEKSNLVAYVSEDDSFITIENYFTLKKQRIFENRLCPAALKGDCIESFYFKNNSAVLKWQGDKWDENNSDVRKKTILIKI